MTRLIDHRYDECGLDNVILKGLPVVVDDDGEEVITIPNVNMLHRVLAATVASKETGLQPKELRFLRTELGLTPRPNWPHSSGRIRRRSVDGSAVRRRWKRVPRWSFAHARSNMPRKAHCFRWMNWRVVRFRLRCSRPFMIDASNPDDYRPLAA